VLIDDLLGFSKMARQSMSTTTIETAAMVQELIREISTQEPARKIEWTVGTLPAVKGDRSLIRQVWWNLLANAVKYTRGKEPAQIEITATIESREIMFKIEDNGAGFDMKYADKLFGVFQRLHAENEFEGTGIGLANVRRIVSRHGGRTWAEGKPGQGAKFFFSLPIDPIEQSGR
jgi:light-regulated signal transduction histidine kinase (bacteriophytochrome)